MRVKIQNSCEQLGVEGVSGSDMFDVLTVAIYLLDKGTRDPSPYGIASTMLDASGSLFLAPDVKPSRQVI